MPRYYEEPVATESAYHQALLAMQSDNDLHLAPGLEMLRCLHGQSGHAATASELASLMGLGSYSAVNLRVGKFAHALAERLSYLPAKRPNGKPMWWSTITIGQKAHSRAPFVFILRPELQAALLSLGWLASHQP